MKILLIDNYDSFTFNVYQYISELGHYVIVKRNDKVTLDEIHTMNPDAIFLSPGPGTPDDAGICLDVIRHFAGSKSIFGVCLGHQAIGQAFGGKVIHARHLFHGKTSLIKSLNKGVMTGITEPLVATRYHSLVVERESLPGCLEVTAEIDTGEIMGLMHKEYNIEGLQFHPESILTKTGKQLLNSFLLRTKKLLNITDDKADISLLSFPVFGKYNLDDSHKIRIRQSAKKTKCQYNSFDLFCKLQQELGGTNSFFLESAAGPQVDCRQTVIGAGPAFEILLSGKYLKIAGPDTRLEQALCGVLEKFYPKTEKGFFLNDDAFSQVFSVLKNAIELNTMHHYTFPVTNALTGYFAYEYLHYIEKIPRIEDKVLGLPEVHLKYFTVYIVFLAEDNDVFLIENKINNRDNPVISGIEAILAGSGSGLEQDASVNSGMHKNAANELPAGNSNITKELFFQNGQKAMQYIYDGDIFQVQLGQRICIEQDVEPLQLYRKLREINPSPYMFYWDAGDYQLISNSPELQLRVEDNTAIIRPIAGTSKGKGNNAEERKKIIEEFSSDRKEQAEHIMLVDLARNDIGRVAIPGTVEVTQLLAVEEYSHVFHLTSTVKGKMTPDLNTMKLFEATFPAGTLTGAPKVRAMEIISELETEVRGPYGGAFGMFDFNGNIVSSIIIRTILRKGKKLYLQASAGFVADSKIENEWNETFHKMQALKTALKDL